MKFISVISLALFAYTAIATPFDRRAASQAVQDANKADAQALNKKFATLNANSPCTNGENACVNGSFTTCANGKFPAGTPCSGGTQCFALPLVNSRGTSVTCDTKADAIARGGIPPDGQGGSGSGSGQGGSGQGGSGQGGTGKPKKSKKNGKKGKKNKNNNNTCNLNPSTASPSPTASPTASPSPSPTTSPTASPSPTTPSTTPPTTGNSGSLADIRKQNAIDAQKLQDSFATLSEGSSCTSGQNACIGGKFAQCSGNKFSSTPCASGEQCFALPLVNKPGTSVTCDTQADRDARFAAAKNGQ